MSYQLYVIGDPTEGKLAHISKVPIIGEVLDWLTSHGTTYERDESKFTLRIASLVCIPVIIHCDELALQLLLTFPELVFRDRPLIARIHW